MLDAGTCCFLLELCLIVGIVQYHIVRYSFPRDVMGACETSQEGADETAHHDAADDAAISSEEEDESPSAAA